MQVADFPSPTVRMITLYETETLRSGKTTGGGDRYA